LPQPHLQAPKPTAQEDGSLNVSRPSVTTFCREAAASGRVVVVECTDCAALPHAVPMTATRHSADTAIRFGLIVLYSPGRSPTRLRLLPKGPRSSMTLGNRDRFAQFSDGPGPWMTQVDDVHTAPARRLSRMNAIVSQSLRSQLNRVPGNKWILSILNRLRCVNGLHYFSKRRRHHMPEDVDRRDHRRICDYCRVHWCDRDTCHRKLPSPITVGYGKWRTELSPV